MDLSKIKMVVSDMDGTLLNSKHEVSERFFEIFYQLKLKGIQFVAASGRQYHSIAEKLDIIKNDIIIIAENGAFAKKQEEELLVTPLLQSQRMELLAKINEIHGAHAMLCGKYTSYFDGNSMAFLEQLKEYYSNYEICEDYSEVTDEILKIAVYHPINAEKYIYPPMKSLEHQVKVKVSGMNWVDLNHIDANKGHALQHIMNLYGLTSDEILVFGDYNNDIEMLALAENSFAMENAHPNVKKVANYTTKSNDSYGVETILAKLLG